MPSLASTFVAGLLLGAGASWGGMALLAPMGVTGVARAEGLEPEAAPPSDTDRAACETLAAMVRTGPGRRPTRPATEPQVEGAVQGDPRLRASCRLSSNLDASELPGAAYRFDWDEFEPDESPSSTSARPGILDRLLARGGTKEAPEAQARREASLWYAIATVHALTGEVGPTLAALEKAATLHPYADQIVYALGQLDPEELAPGIARLIERVPGALVSVRPLVEALLSVEPAKVSEAFALEERALDRPRDGKDDRVRTVAPLVEVDAPRTDAILVPRAASFTRGELSVITTRFLDHGDRAIAATWWKRLSEKAPSPDDGELDLRNLRRAFDPSAVVSDLRATLEKTPDDGSVWARLATALLEAGDRRGAFEATLEALRCTPGDAGLLSQLVDLDPAAALPSLERLARGPKNVALLKVLGRGFVKNGLLEKASEAFFQAEERNPADYELMRLLVALDPRRALVRLTEMTSKATWEGDDEVLGARANALMATGDAGAAYTVYAKALEIDPGDCDWLAGLARADPVRAVPWLEAQLAKAPKDTDTAGALAAAYAETGRASEAMALFERALRKANTGTRWLTPYAKLAPQRAMALAEELADRNPAAGDAWTTLGDVYRELGKVEEAKSAYETAQQREPRGAEIAVKLARLR